MRLPEKFTDKMKDLLKDEYEDFLASYEKQYFKGLRINTLKISVEEFLKISPFSLKPIPWCEDGFYFDEESPAKHPYYHAGLYYIQEPSAMAPVSFLSPNKGDHVLDVCAAPGGKSVQIACALKGEGVLITNDINLNRVKPLIKNMELFGIKNAIVMNESIEKIKRYFPNYFDKILVDAPCSGEGMFRKDSSMIKSWEKHDHNYYIPIQREIMKHVDELLNGEGKIVYSTCTFSIEENEEIINEFLEENDNFHMLDIEKKYGISEGISNKRDEIKKCARLLPHKVEGEGHFLAFMGKTEKESNYSYKNEKIKIPNVFYDFVKENLTIDIEGDFQIHKDNLYRVPKELPNMKGLKVLRSGWLLGTFKKNRFEPSHALAMGLSMKDAKRFVNFNKDDFEVIKYLKGETLHTKGEKGWTLVCVDGYPLGWSKHTGSILKNYYPPSWRWMD
ncbi:RsmF rRNA methyltransferase first C-terminal domain-containing protein [Anaerophilus nitritogenes]|uniref:RsmF rRNA methyltransferase first C-terminal domain-containing protein n=1 Tax=Anaerophilus nitritogenes TaxID=2498136 RepID=UPI00101B8539|nr:RsmB/NOP family class I SAM-dependent RNA methyltransferase [Anaerophilus nitritogenes]